MKQRGTDLHVNSVTSFPYNGTTIGLTHCDAVLTQDGGGAFSIRSFDFAGFPGYEGSFSVTGYFFEGGTITANFTPDGLVDGIGGVADFQTFSLGSEWTNLAKVIGSIQEMSLLLIISRWRVLLV